MRLWPTTELWVWKLCPKSSCPWVDMTNNLSVNNQTHWIGDENMREWDGGGAEGRGGKAMKGTS